MVSRHVLETSRLALREMTLNDLDFVAAMLADREVMRFYPKPYSREESRQWIQRVLDRYERDGHAFWLVEEKQTRQPIGQVGPLIQRVDGHHEMEIGYLIHRLHWRQGFAREAVCAVRDYVFRELNQTRIVSLIAPANIASQRVALSYGAKPEKLVRWHERDHLLFALPRTE